MEKKKQDAMKYRLADAMKVCMKTMPVEKITVGEIVAEGKTTRQTFTIFALQQNFFISKTKMKKTVSLFVLKKFFLLFQTFRAFPI